MKELKYPELFPIAYGNEEEGTVMVGLAGDDVNAFSPALDFLARHREYVPASIKTVREDANRQHTQGGAVMYRTGSQGATLLETATPECSRPQEIASAIQSTERLRVKMASAYVRERAASDRPVELRMQRRTVDGYGNTAASHDSFEARRPNWLRNFESNKDARLAMLAHMATRSFMTGAGYVDQDQLYFAQKARHLKSLEGYGFIDSAYRRDVTETSDTGARMEWRCGDKNLSPWAIKERVVGAALVFTALQIDELLPALRDRVPTIMRRGDEAIVDAFRLYNMAYLEPDGTMKAAELTHDAVDFQEWQFTVLAQHLGNYVELDQEHLDIVEEGIKYCQDFREVLAGRETVRLLTDRSDNAVKFAKIAASVQRGLDDGFDRSVTDDISRMWDLRYDHIQVSPGLGKDVRVEYGYGYKWRDKGGFKDQVPDESVERGLYYPPETTRAHVRGYLIRRQKIEQCQWNKIRVGYRPEDMEDFSLKQVKLPDAVLRPTDRQLSPEAYVRLRGRDMAPQIGAL